MFFFLLGLEGASAKLLALLEHDGAPCKNKSCVRRGTTEDKLLIKWEQVNTVMVAKVKGAQKLRRSVRKQEGVLGGVTAVGISSSKTCGETFTMNTWNEKAQARVRGRKRALPFVPGVHFPPGNKYTVRCSPRLAAVDNNYYIVSRMHTRGEAWSSLPPHSFQGAFFFQLYFLWTFPSALPASSSLPRAGSSTRRLKPPQL